MQNTEIKKIGEYSLYETIGKGSFSKVRRAINNKTKKNFAVKIMYLNQFKEKQQKVQLAREIEIIKKLQGHPNVVKLDKVLKSKTKIYIVMELLPSDVFKEILNSPNEKLDEKRALKYFQQLIFVIDYCHSKNVVHRDLKTENLLLDKK
jgi:serine/threonine protein kinase